MSLMGFVPNLNNRESNRLKMMVYGAAGTGKTICSLGFPKPYLIDTERGTHAEPYYDELLVKNGGMKLETQDFNEMYKAVTMLSNTKHEYKTLIIDPITIIYQNTVDDCEQKLGEKTGFNKQYSETNKLFRRFFNLLYKLDMNIILTSHAKSEYEVKNVNGKNEMVAKGLTYDMVKKTDYMLDLLLEVKFINNKRMAVIKKSRLRSFPLEDQFLFNYDEFAKRYDKNVLERDSSVINTITPDTLSLLEELFESHGYDENSIKKWLRKKNLADLSDLKESDAQTVIHQMKTKEEMEKNSAKNFIEKLGHEEKVNG